MGWAKRWELQGVCTTALARIAAATAMAGNTRQTRSGLRLWRGERWRTKNRIGGTVTSCEDEGRMTKDESSFDRHSSFLYYGLRKPRFPYSLQFFFPSRAKKEL